MIRNLKSDIHYAPSVLRSMKGKARVKRAVLVPLMGTQGRAGDEETLSPCFSRHPVPEAEPQSHFHDAINLCFSLLKLRLLAASAQIVWSALNKSHIV